MNLLSLVALDRETLFLLIYLFFALNVLVTILSVPLIKMSGSQLDSLLMGLLFCIYFFANDLFLFAEASINQAMIINQCLSDFCDASGQKVNIEKSKLYCSRNVNINKAT